MAAQLDDIDKHILTFLQDDGALRPGEISSKLQETGLKALKEGAISNRVKRLKDEGYIKKTVAILDPDKINRTALSFYTVKMQDRSSEQAKKFIKEARKNPDILEIYSVIGQYDYILKVVASKPAELGRISMELGDFSADIQTLLVTDTHRETTALNLFADKNGDADRPAEK